MQTYALLVFSNPAEGREADYEAWYGGGRLEEIASVPGVSAVQRFRLNHVGRGELAHKHLTIFELGAATAEAATADLKALTSAGLMAPPAARADDLLANLFEVCSPKIPNPTAGPSGDFIFMSMNNPVPGREAEYNAWYNNEHVADVINVEGFTVGQRITLRQRLIGEPRHRYAALFRMEADSIEAAGVAMKRGAEAGLGSSDDIAKGGISTLLQACSARGGQPVGLVGAS
jgi:hypothetical protein